MACCPRHAAALPPPAPQAQHLQPLQHPTGALGAACQHQAAAGGYGYGCGCARSRGSGSASRRGHREPEAVAAAAAKRRFLSATPYIVSGLAAACLSALHQEKRPTAQPQCACLVCQAKHSTQNRQPDFSFGRVCRLVAARTAGSAAIAPPGRQAAAPLAPLCPLGWGRQPLPGPVHGAALCGDARHPGPPHHRRQERHPRHRRLHQAAARRRFGKCATPVFEPASFTCQAPAK